MCSQESLSHFLKNRRLQYTRTHEGSVEQTPRPAPRAYVAPREIKLLWEAPEHRRGLGNKKFSIEELSHGKKKSEHLPRLTGSVSEGHSPDPKGCLNTVSKRFQRGDSAEGQGHRRTFAGHLGLPKNSPEAVTAWEAQANRRTTALLGKARKQTEKTPNPEDARQFLEQEVVVNNKNPTKKCQQLKNLEDLRRDRLEGGGDIELRQPQGPYRCGKHLAPLEENIFLQGKKIKPHSRYPMQAVFSPSVREEQPGKKLKPEPSGQATLEDMKASKEREAQPQFLQENTFLEGPSRELDQNLLAEAKSQLLNRRKMQASEVAKSHDKEFWVFGTSRKIQLSFQDSKQGASGRNRVRHKWQPREEGWDPTIQGTPVVLAARAHTYSYQGPKDRCASKTRLTLRKGKPNITYS